MNVFEHPLLFVFAFTLLVCLAGMWLLLRGRRDSADDEQSTQPFLREEDRSGVEILQEMQSAMMSLDQYERVSPASMGLDKREADAQFLRREETISRLALLDDLIAKQRSCMASARTMRLDLSLLEEQMKILTDTREEYYSALKSLLLDCSGAESEKGRKH